VMPHTGSLAHEVMKAANRGMRVPCARQSCGSGFFQFCLRQNALESGLFSGKAVFLHSFGTTRWKTAPDAAPRSVPNAPSVGALIRSCLKEVMQVFNFEHMLDTTSESS
jgi:hypothetical protein